MGNQDKYNKKKKDGTEGHKLLVLQRSLVSGPGQRNHININTSKHMDGSMD